MADRKRGVGSRLVSVNVGLPLRCRVARKDGSHRHLEGARLGPPHGPAAQHRRRWPGGPRRPRRRASGRSRLSDRFLSLLGGAARAERAHPWAARRELHGRGPARQRGVHRGSLPDRGRGLRGDAAARHLLPPRHPHGRAADGSASRGARQAGLLSARPRGGRGRGRRRDPAGRGCSRAHDRRGGERAALQARPSARPARAGVAHRSTQPWLARLLPGAAGSGARRRCRQRQSGAHHGRRPSHPPGRAFGPCACRPRPARAPM